MKFAHVVIKGPTPRTKGRVLTLCGRLYIPGTIRKITTGVYAQKCPDCVKALAEENWITIEPNV